MARVVGSDGTGHEREGGEIAAVWFDSLERAEFQES
jgi:hypothetical protein